MDTSEQYIQMSFKAWSDLKKDGWKWDIGDFFSDGVVVGVITKFLFLDDAIVPLLRQDQLQMLSGMSNLEFFYAFTSFVKHYIVNDLDDLAEDLDVSFEVLHLMFLMKEKFNKIWDSNKKEWVENDQRRIR